MAGPDRVCGVREAAVDRLETRLLAELPELAGDGETLRFSPRCGHLKRLQTSPDISWRPQSSPAGSHWSKDLGAGLTLSAN